VAGSIALRYGDFALADRRFSDALARSPNDAYALLERGAIASSSGRPAAAVRLLARAAQLQPHDQLTQSALALARAGHRVSVAELNRSILSEAQQLR
jgi:Flp pilus assembly protein TadD